jgi:hypothetical protein
MRATRRSPFSHPSRTLAHPAREARVLKQHGVGEGESEVGADFRNGCRLLARACRCDHSSPPPLRGPHRGAVVKLEHLARPRFLIHHQLSTQLHSGTEAIRMSDMPIT